MPQHFSLIQLPPEIRNMILHIIGRKEPQMAMLCHKDPSDEQEHELQWERTISTRPRSTLWSLAITCRALYREAFSVLFRYLQISVTIDCGRKISPRFFRTLSQGPRVQDIRHPIVDIPVQMDTVDLFETFFTAVDWGERLHSLHITWCIDVAHGDLSGEAFIEDLVHQQNPRPQDWWKLDHEAYKRQERQKPQIKQQFAHAWSKLRVRGKVIHRRRWGSEEDIEFEQMIYDADEKRIARMNEKGRSTEGAEFTQRLYVETWK